MKLNQVAVQLWTVRDHCKTPPDLAATAKKLRAIGYTAVQLSGLGPIADDEIVRIMAGEGLTICATHEPSEDILERPEKCIDTLRALGCTLTAYPFPVGIEFDSAGSVETLVRKLDAAGEKFHEAGLVLGYHNHGIEFVKFRGAAVLDYIYDNTDPRHLVAELDTYWIHYGGGDVIEWCRKLRGRMPFIHLKDYGYSLEKKSPTHCEIGAGYLPFARIIAEAEAGGCEWFIVEQDTCPGDPFDSLRQSYDYICAKLIG